MRAKRPNLLFLMVDQQRFDCIGRSGRYPVRTPNLDRLAAEGAWFENAFTPMPLCSPARQSLLCGLRPERYGGLWNVSGGFPVRALEPGMETWTRALHDSGYRMGYLGKWHVNREHDPRDFGYDEYIPTSAYNEYRAKEHPEYALREGWFGEHGWFGDPDPIPLEFSGTHWMAARAVDMMERYAKSSEPWHIRLDFIEPHLPCMPAKPFSEMYPPQEIPEWESFRDSFENKPYIQRQQLVSWGVEDYTWEDWRQVVSRYYGAISQIDDAISNVLRALDRLGLSDDTIVIYTSDHGDFCGGHRMMDKQYALYDDILRVPLIIRWPGMIKPGQVIDEYIYNCLDLSPTLREIFSLPSARMCDGRSFRKLLMGGEAPDWRREIVSTCNGMQFGLYTNRCLRGDRWKYVWNTTDIDELYDLESDPGELRNRIRDPENAALVRDMRRRLYDSLLEAGDSLAQSEWMRYQLLEGKKL